MAPGAASSATDPLDDPGPTNLCLNEYNSVFGSHLPLARATESLVPRAILILQIVWENRLWRIDVWRFPCETPEWLHRGLRNWH